MPQRRRNTRLTLGTRGAAPSRTPRGPPRAADPAQNCYTEDGKIRLQVRVYPPDVCVNLGLMLIITHLFALEG